MKIAPVTERWNEGERDWSFVENAAPGIKAWEQREGIILPADYRAFMLSYNGGSVYPRLFKDNVPVGILPGTDQVSYVDRISSWKNVEAHWRGDIYGAGLPPRHLLIGDTPGALQILMSISGNLTGKVCGWVHSTNTWGTDGNTELYQLADSFNGFLRQLYDDGDQSDYEDWYLPAYRNIIKEFTIG